MIIYAIGASSAHSFRMHWMKPPLITFFLDKTDIFLFIVTIHSNAHDYLLLINDIVKYDGCQPSATQKKTICDRFRTVARWPSASKIMAKFLCKPLDDLKKSLYTYKVNVKTPSHEREFNGLCHFAIGVVRLFLFLDNRIPSATPLHIAVYANFCPVKGAGRILSQRPSPTKECWVIAPCPIGSKGVHRSTGFIDLTKGGTYGRNDQN